MTNICIRCGQEIEDAIQGTNLCEPCYAVVADAAIEVEDFERFDYDLES